MVKYDKFERVNSVLSKYRRALKNPTDEDRAATRHLHEMINEYADFIDMDESIDGRTKLDELLNLHKKIIPLVDCVISKDDAQEIIEALKKMMGII